jgi:hypothetical protein
MSSSSPSSLHSDDYRAIIELCLRSSPSNDNKLAYMRHAPLGSFNDASAQLMAVNDNNEIK